MSNQGFGQVSAAVYLATFAVSGCGSSASQQVEPTQASAGSESAQVNEPVSGQERIPGIVRAVEQGQQYWAVFVYVGGPGPDMDAAVANLTERGLERGLDFSEGDLACSVGASAAIGASPDSMAVSVYFEDEQNAQRFAHGFDDGQMAQVTASCVD